MEPELGSVYLVGKNETNMNGHWQRNGDWVALCTSR